MGLYEKLAAAIPKVTALRCTVCGNTRNPRQSQVAGFFAAGWPKCCGFTMHMHTEADPAPGEANEVSALKAPPETAPARETEKEQK